MYYLEKIFKVPIGHRLSKHSGLCKNNHGHTISVLIKLIATKLDHNDMVIDFSQFKEIANDVFVDDFDHCMLLNSQDEAEISHYRDHFRKWFSFSNADPTAETISKYIFEEFNNTLEDIYDSIRCYSVKVWESETANCMYTDDDYIQKFIESDNNTKTFKISKNRNDSGLVMKYFVLKPEGDDIYAEASRRAILAYSDHIGNDNKKLNRDLKNWLVSLTEDDQVKLDKKIEHVHSRNLHLIKKHNIQIGDVFVSKAKPTYTETLCHIHPLYGWLQTDGQKLPQEVEEALKIYEHIRN